MAITKFNSIDGYTVNESTQITVVDANANFYANNLTVTAASDLGAVGNVKITGGTANYILQTNGSGVLSWTNPGASGLAGSDKQVQFNNDGNFGASSNFTFNSSTNLLTVGNLTVTSGGTSNLGNLATANYISGNGYGITGLPLGNLSDVVLSYPSTGQILTYNGVNWINGSAGSSSAGQGVKYWLTSIAITASSVNNSFEIDSLSQTPYTPSSTLLSTSVNNNTLPMAAWETNALNRTIFDAGSYDFSVYANINAVGGTNTFELDFYQVIPFVSGTVTITGSGTSRTATASTGTPFSGVTASGTNTTSSWLQTPNGLYQITAKTNDTVVTISTPSGFSNENAVAGQVWNQLFKSGSMAVVSTVLTEFQFSSTQPSFNVTVASKLGIITFATSDTTKTLTFSLDGSVQDSHFTTPLVILHDDLAGLQGGTNEEYFHLTTSEYTANGTGTFIRQSGATLITPNVGVASGTSVSVTGNISRGNPNLGTLATANYFSGNGIYLSSLTGANVTGTVANANYSTYAGTVITAAQPNITSIGTLVNTTMGASNSLSGGNLVSATYLSGTITTGAQPNITSLGTLTSLTTTANMTSGNADLGNLATANYFSGNGIYISNIAGANVSGTVANATYATSAGSATTAGTVTTNAQPNITSIGTLSSLTVTANISSGNANLGNLATASYFTGTLTTGAQPNITSVGSLGSLTVTGLITNTGTGIKTSNIQDSSGTITIVTGYGSVSGAVGIYGNITAGTSGTGFFVGNGSYLSGLTGGNVSGQVGNALVAGTVYTNAQPNITSVGSLTGLTVSNATGIVNFTTTANVTLGAVANLHISGGTSGYVLSTDGSGTLSWVAQSGGGGGTPGGSDTQVQFNDGGSFGGNSAFTFNKTTGNVVMTGNLITGSGTGGNITGLNYVTANYLTGTLTTAVQPNITSVGSLSGLTVSNATGVVNFTTTANVTLGAVANLHISGGTSGYVLSTDGSGTLSWVAQSGGGGSPGGLDTYVQFNDGGTTFGGNAQLTYNKVTNLLSVGGNLTISGLTTLGETTDTLNTKTGATGSVTHDLSTGVVFYHTSISANFTAALTNAPTTDGRTIVVVLFLVQGATAYIPNAVTINGGAAVTIKWLFGSTPGGNANKTDGVSFTLIRTGSAWIVLGQLATYG